MSAFFGDRLEKAKWHFAGFVRCSFNTNAIPFLDRSEIKSNQSPMSWCRRRYRTHRNFHMNFMRARVGNRLTWQKTNPTTSRLHLTTWLLLSATNHFLFYFYSFVKATSLLCGTDEKKRALQIPFVHFQKKKKPTVQKEKKRAPFVFHLVDDVRECACDTEYGNW